MTAVERIKNEIDSRNQAFRERLETSPELRELIAELPEGERVKFRTGAMDQYAKDDQYRAGTLLEQSGFMNAVNVFNEKFGLSDGELESVMTGFVNGVDKFKSDEPASKLDRLKQNFKDASLGVEDVGSVAGVIYDEGKFGLGELNSKLKSTQSSIAQAEHVQSVRAKAVMGDSMSKTALGYLPFSSLSDEDLGEEIKSMGHRVELLNSQARESGLEYLKTLAKRNGEYAGLPEWKGLSEGSVALTGQLLGAFASPENLIPTGGGAAVAGTLAKRVLTRGARQAGENVAANALTEPIVQQHRIDQGMQDGFSMQGALIRSGLATVVGVGLGGAKGIKKPKGAQELVDVSDKIEPASKTPTPEGVANTPTTKQVTSKFAERIAKDDRIKDAEKILTDPKHKHYVQNLQADTDKLSELTDNQLSALVDSNKFDSNLSILSGHVLRERIFEKGGDTTEVDRLLSKKLTTIGQLLRSARMIKTTPANLVQSVKKQIEKHDRKVPEHIEKQLKNMAERQERLRLRHNRARKKAEKSFTTKNEREFIESERALNKIGTRMERKVNGLVPRGVWDSASGALKGNLLTLKSFIVNPLGNAALLPMREMGNVAAAAVDKFTPGKRTITNPVSPSAYFDRGAESVKALGKAAKALITNDSDVDYLKGDIQRGFQPIRSFAQAFAQGEKSSLAVGPDGKVKRSDRARAFVEGLLGLQAEPAFRLLRMGDDPFYAQAYRAELINQAHLRGFKPGTLEWRKFMVLKDGDAALQAKNAGQKATFSAENRMGQAINRFINKDLGSHKTLGGPMKFLATTQVPFVQFPVNYINAALPYVSPEFGLIKAVMKYRDGDARAGHEAVGQAITGAIVRTGAAWLWQNELITPPVQYDNAKLRALQYEGNSQGIPSGSLNVSALKRKLFNPDGDGNKFQDGDVYVEFEKFGIPGMAMFLASQKGATTQRRAAEGKLESNPALEVMSRFPDTAKFFTDQTFLAGTSAFLSALEDWDRYGDSWLANTLNTASASVVNNTTQQIAKAEWEHIPEMRVPDKPWESFTNYWHFKTGVLPFSDGLNQDTMPVKVGLFGEKANRTPEGSNNIAFNMLDPTNARKARSNPRIAFLWDAYRKTGSSAVLPNHPTDIIRVGNKAFRLTPKQHEELKILSGKARAQMLDKLIEGKPINNKDAIEQVLTHVWSTANKVGQMQFRAKTNVSSLEEIQLNRAIGDSPNPLGQ